MHALDIKFVTNPKSPCCSNDVSWATHAQVDGRAEFVHITEWNSSGREHTIHREV
jgi:hypothetical protein